MSSVVVLMDDILLSNDASQPKENENLHVMTTKKGGLIDNLSRRQSRLLPLYNSANSMIFGRNDFTLVYPDASTYILSDENNTITSLLLGENVDIQIRKIVAKYLFFVLLLELIAFILGSLVMGRKIPSWVAYLTFPGSIFPIFLLCRSHTHIFVALLKQWEPTFLLAYSVMFCISSSLILEQQNIPCESAAFIFFVIFPSLVAAAFADASAIRLDHAFIINDISASVIGTPPYLVALASVLLVLALLFRNANPVEQHGILITMVTSTGTTLALFLLRSLLLLVIDPKHCVSLRAVMRVSVATLDRANAKEDSGEVGAVGTAPASPNVVDRSQLSTTITINPSICVAVEDL